MNALSFLLLMNKLQFIIRDLILNTHELALIGLKIYFKLEPIDEYFEAFLYSYFGDKTPFPETLLQVHQARVRLTFAYTYLHSRVSQPVFGITICERKKLTFSRYSKDNYWIMSWMVNNLCCAFYTRTTCRNLPHTMKRQRNMCTFNVCTILTKQTNKQTNITKNKETTPKQNKTKQQHQQQNVFYNSNNNIKY